MKKLVKKIFCYKRMYLLIALPLSFILVALAKLDNGWVEHFFVPFIYKPISYIIGTLVSLVPFSLTELLVVILTAFAVYYIVRVIIKIVKTKKIKHELYKLFINILCVISMALFLFQVTMGLNYYRCPVTHYLDLEVKPRSTQELYQLCSQLIDDMNENRGALKNAADGSALLLDKNRTETSNEARAAYKKLSEKYPVLKSANIRNKPLVSSKLFSMVLTTGIYIPYTFESNINVDVPEFNIPATMCHELTHYRGFMAEDEANFIGYLACMESDRADFKYSGAFMAFGYCYNALADADPELAAKLVDKVDRGVLSDIMANDVYWEKYRDTVVSQVSDKVYDSYLVMNDQPEGIRSYGKMVDLLLAYYAKS